MADLPDYLLEAYDNVRSQLESAMRYAAQHADDDANGAAIIAIAQGRVEGVGIVAHHLVGDAADDELLGRWVRQYQRLPLTNDFNYRHRREATVQYNDVGFDDDGVHFYVDGDPVVIDWQQSGTAHSHPGFDHNHTAGDQPHEHQVTRDRKDLPSR